jgi:geranylgeranyl reductase family protein
MSQPITAKELSHKNTVQLNNAIFDIIIIGAGPAGLNAGLAAAGTKGTSPSTLLVDKIAPWDHPIQCAEAIGRLGFEEAVDVREGWIRQVIGKASFHAPDGTTITYTDKNKGYIIDRARMQKELAQELAGKGAVCVFDRRVAKIASVKDSLRAVEFVDGTKCFGKVVIDASGPVGGFGRGEKIDWKPLDLEPAYFIWAESIDLPQDAVHIYMGRDLAPGGYAWAFPRGKGAANIGIVVGHEFRSAANIRGLLDAFLARNFPSITIVKRFAGSIPCACKHGPVALPRLIKAGDAASTVNPISRAGIAEALLCGKLAGEHALAMLGAKNEREMAKAAKAYEAAWRKKRGTLHEKLSKSKHSLLSVPDKDYNKAAHALVKIPQDEITMSKIFTTALGRFPRLVWALRHLM